MKYCDNSFVGKRRVTREVKVGDVGVGAHNPIRIQTMLISNTSDTAACVAEAVPILEAGCEILRLTVPAVEDAKKLKDFVAAIRARGFRTPIVADVHFVPAAAMEAAQWCEKVRINPGNYADRKKFVVREYTDDLYEQELERLEKAFTPLVLRLKELGRALRIGTNHGSLSDRIINRYGDTPLGMVESALEFVRICRRHNYHDIILSMKASNPKVMIQAYRLLVARLYAEGPDWNYPLHLGVTEAGAGEDGRIKSGVGIGALLEDGIGDTVRVSLTEDSIHEITVCRELVRKYNERWSLPREGGGRPAEVFLLKETRDPFQYSRRRTRPVLVGDREVGGANFVRVAGVEFSVDDPAILEVDVLAKADFWQQLRNQPPHLLTVRDGVALEPVGAFRLLVAQMDAHGLDWPVLLKDTLDPQLLREEVAATLTASANLGALLCDGIGDAVWVRLGRDPKLADNILQATGVRLHKADYVACPSCGRTQFDLQTVTARIQERTQHLKGVKIAVMGCIVNGPGEMADADFGYVGTAPGRVSLWVGKTPVKHHIPEEQAVEELVALIQAHGRWQEPPQPE